jgi:hypothetical protein
MCDIDIRSENQNNYINWLSSKLRDMSHEILHFVNEWGAGRDETQYRKYMKDSENFIIGSFICQKYLYGSIDLDEFCAEMVNENLESFLMEIPYIPEEVLTKYGVNCNVVEDEKEEETNKVEGHQATQVDDNTNDDEGFMDV